MAGVGSTLKVQSRQQGPAHRAGTPTPLSEESAAVSHVAAWTPKPTTRVPRSHLVLEPLCPHLPALPRVSSPAHAVVHMSSSGQRLSPSPSRITCSRLPLSRLDEDVRPAWPSVEPLLGRASPRPHPSPFSSSSLSFAGCFLSPHVSQESFSFSPLHSSPWRAEATRSPRR